MEPGLCVFIGLGEFVLQHSQIILVSLGFALSQLYLLGVEAGLGLKIGVLGDGCLWASFSL